MARPNARDLIDLVLDADSWTSWDTPPVRTGISEEYAAELAAAAEKSGVDESVLTGEGSLRGGGSRCWWASSAFLAGSIGRASADRIVTAVERATADGLPLLAAPVSGGTRMQEGTPAFVQMVRISQAVAAHKSAGLPYLVYLRHPTTGGVMASWGSLGHVTVAEPGALVGFLGPRVYSALYGKDFPEGVQTSENLYARGIIDAVVAPEEIGDILDRALSILMAPRSGVPVAAGPARRAGPRRRHLGRRHPLAARRPARRTPAAEVRRRRRRPAQRHRPGRAGPRPADRAGALRAGAVRLPRAGPPRPDRRPPDGPAGAARGPARLPAGLRARAAAGHRDRHPGRRALPRGRERRPRRRDRPLPGRAGLARRPRRCA